MIWTLITTQGNGSGGITNGHPKANNYDGTFIHLGTLGASNVYAICGLFQPEGDNSGANWQQGAPSVVAAGYIANSNVPPICSNIQQNCFPSLYPITIPAATTSASITGTFTNTESDAIPICSGGNNFTQWIVKVDGVPNGTVHYTDANGAVVAAPTTFTYGACGNTANTRQFLSTQVLSLTTTDSSLTVPATANWGEAYVVGGDIIWSLTNTSSAGTTVYSEGSLDIESRSELLSFLVKANTTATLIVNYFIN